MPLPSLVSTGRVLINTPPAIQLDCRVYRSTTQSLSAGVLTAMSFDVERWDTGGFWLSGAPTRLTIPRAGLYICGSHVDFGAVAGGGGRYTDIAVNNTTGIAQGSGGFFTVSTEDPQVEACTIWRFAAGDYIESRAYSGTTLSVQASTATLANSNEFWISWLGP